MEPTQRIRLADDINLEVVCAGPPAAPPVVFVHGNGPNCRQFGPQFTTLADHYWPVDPLRTVRRAGPSRA